MAKQKLIELVRKPVLNEDGTPQTKTRKVSKRDKDGKIVKDEKGEPVKEDKELPVYQDWTFPSEELETWTPKHELPNFRDFADPLSGVEFARVKLSPQFKDDIGFAFDVLKAFSKPEAVAEFADSVLQSEYDRLSAMSEEQRIEEWAAKRSAGRVSEAEKIMRTFSVDMDLYTRLAAAQEAGNLEEIHALRTQIAAAIMAAPLPGQSA